MESLYLNAIVGNNGSQSFSSISPLLPQLGDVIFTLVSVILTAVVTVYFIEGRREEVATRSSRRQVYSQLKGKRDTLWQFYASFIEMDTMCTYYKSESEFGLVFENPVAARDYERYITNHDKLIIEMAKQNGGFVESLSLSQQVFRNTTNLNEKTKNVIYTTNVFRGRVPPLANPHLTPCSTRTPRRRLSPSPKE
jgi:hypothetical protein